MKYTILVLALFACAGSCMCGTAVITKGGTYTFDWSNDDPSVPAVDIQTTETVILDRCTIISAGHGIMANRGGAQLCVQNSRIDGLNWKSNGVGVLVAQCDILIVRNNLFRYLDAGVVAHDGRARCDWQMTIHQNIFEHILEMSAVQLVNVRFNPKVSIQWNQIKGCIGDAISMYYSSGLPGAPIIIANNYIEDVVPLDRLAWFNSTGICMDGPTKDPMWATSSIWIANNQVIGCVPQGIALAMGLNIIAEGNTVICSGLTPEGQPYRMARVAMTIQGDSKYNHLDWLKTVQALNNILGANFIERPLELRMDYFFNYPELTAPYFRGNRSPHDGEITLADEQEQWELWKLKCRAKGMQIGPL